jgi:hypothetical protein
MLSSIGRLAMPIAAQRPNAAICLIVAPTRAASRHPARSASA